MGKARNTERQREDRLQRYFDGELEPSDREAMREALAEDESLSAKLDGLRHLRDLMREGASATLDDVDSDALFSQITAKLEASDSSDAVSDDDPMFPEPAMEIDEEDADAEVEAASEPAVSPRAKLRVVEGGRPSDPQHEVPAQLIRHEAPSRTGWWLGIAGGLAAAAAAVFFILRDPAVSSTTTAETETAPPGSEIEDVDFGYSTGSIFTVEDPEEEDTRYAVIWISDEKVDDDDDDPVAPPEGQTPEGLAPDEGGMPDEGGTPDEVTPDEPSPDALRAAPREPAEPATNPAEVAPSEDEGAPAEEP
ncbi:MAG: hypothetical protein AB7S26_30330 [Sandaracinaceae bacterium]